MYPWNDRNPPPAGSFVEPVPIPDAEPLDAPLVAARFNKSWLPYVLGSLQQLLLQHTWDTTDKALLQAAQQNAFDLIAIIGSAIDVTPIIDVRLDPDNPCILQRTYDGTTWENWADLSTCVSDGIQSKINDGTLTSYPTSDPRTQGTPPNPWPPDKVPSGQTAQCLSGANCSAALKEAVTTLVAQLTAGAGFAGFVASILALESVIFPIVSDIFAAVAALVDASISLGADVINAAFTDTIYTDFACIINCRAGSQGEITQSAFDGIRSQCNSHFSGAAHDIILQWLDAQGPNGLTKWAAAENIFSHDCSSCGCSFDVNWIVDTGTGPTGGNIGDEITMTGPAGSWFIRNITPCMKITVLSESGWVPFSGFAFIWDGHLCDGTFWEDDTSHCSDPFCYDRTRCLSNIQSQSGAASPYTITFRIDGTC